MGYQVTKENGDRVVRSAAGLADEVVVVTADITLRPEDSGKVFLVGTAALTITLPATSAGVKYTFINSGADGNNRIRVTPQSDDAIFGTVANAAADSVANGTDGNHFENTLATANRGDRVTLIADGVDGYYVKMGVGIWASGS